jgi:hypothetical protein
MKLLTIPATMNTDDLGGSKRQAPSSVSWLGHSTCSYSCSHVWRQLDPGACGSMCKKDDKEVAEDRIEMLSQDKSDWGADTNVSSQSQSRSVPKESTKEHGRGEQVSLNGGPGSEVVVKGGGRGRGADTTSNGKKSPASGDPRHRMKVSRVGVARKSSSGSLSPSTSPVLLCVSDRSD